MKELKMAEAKGLSKPVKLKNELAEFLGATDAQSTTRMMHVCGENRR